MKLAGGGQDSAHRQGVAAAAGVHLRRAISGYYSLSCSQRRADREESSAHCPWSQPRWPERCARHVGR